MFFICAKISGIKDFENLLVSGAKICRHPKSAEPRAACRYIIPCDAPFAEIDAAMRNKWLKSWFDVETDAVKIGSCIEKLKCPCAANCTACRKEII